MKGYLAINSASDTGLNPGDEEFLISCSFSSHGEVEQPSLVSQVQPVRAFSRVFGLITAFLSEKGRRRGVVGARPRCDDKLKCVEVTLYPSCENKGVEGFCSRAFSF